MPWTLAQVTCEEFRARRGDFLVVREEQGAMREVVGHLEADVINKLIITLAAEQEREEEREARRIVRAPIKGIGEPET